MRRLLSRIRCPFEHHTQLSFVLYLPENVCLHYLLLRPTARPAILTALTAFASDASSSCSCRCCVFTATATSASCSIWVYCRTGIWDVATRAAQTGDGSTSLCRHSPAPPFSYIFSVKRTTRDLYSGYMTKHESCAFLQRASAGRSAINTRCVTCAAPPVRIRIMHSANSIKTHPSRTFNLL